NRWLIRRDPNAGGPRWKVQTGHDVATCLTVHPTRPIVAVGYVGGEVELRDLEKGRFLHSLKGTGEVYAVAFSPDGTLLAVGGGDGLLRIWDVGRGELVSVQDGHEGAIGAVAWSPDGWRLATLAGA